MLIRILTLLLFLAPSAGAQSDAEQRKFIEAAFHLKLELVQTMLAVDPTLATARYGRRDPEAFRDPWTLGYSHMGSSQWTALQAACNSNTAADPVEPVENTEASLERARAIRAAIPKEVRARRDAVRLKIVKLLVEAKAPLNHHDGFGATALYSAIYNGFDDVATHLIQHDAQVNTRTGIYIDGSGDITPLHRAIGRPAMITLLLKHGADKRAKDSKGRTAYEWAETMGFSEGAELLKP